MKHAHVLITGTSGSGKTSMARQLLQLTPRAVVIDPQGDYAADPGVIRFETFRQLATYLIAREDSDDFRLAYCPAAGLGADDAFRAVMDLTFRFQSQRPDRPPIGVFLEEASIYSRSNVVPEEVDRLIRTGRTWGINTVSVVQGDVDIGKSLRRNITLNVFMRQYLTSATVRELIPEYRGQLDELEVMERGPATRPEYGRHFLTFPPDTFPHRAWASAVAR